MLRFSEVLRYIHIMRDAAVSVSLSSFRHRRQDHTGSEVGDAIASLGFDAWLSCRHRPVAQVVRAYA